MDYYDVIRLLDEIAVVIPELLERATEISIDSSDKQRCKIVIRDNYAGSYKEVLLTHFSGQNLQMVERSSGVWIIY